MTASSLKGFSSHLNPESCLISWLLCQRWCRINCCKHNNKIRLISVKSSLCLKLIKKRLLSLENSTESLQRPQNRSFTAAQHKITRIYRRKQTHWMFFCSSECNYWHKKLKYQTNKLQHLPWSRYFVRRSYEQFLSFVITRGEEEELAAFFLRLVAQIQYERNVRGEKTKVLLPGEEYVSSCPISAKCTFFAQILQTQFSTRLRIIFIWRFMTKLKQILIFI